MNSSEAIWKQYQARLRAYVSRRVDGAAEVDDLLQDIFIKIHTRLEALRDEARLVPWLFQITRNAINDHYRAHGPQQALGEELPMEEDEGVEQARRELESCFQPMIDSLPDTYRDAVRLSEIEGMTQEAVAERLGLSLSGAKSRVQRGREKIRGMMESCCHLEFDHRGRLVDYDDKKNSYC